MDKAAVRITYDDTRSPSVDAILQQQAEEAAARAGQQRGAAAAKSARVSLIYESWFNLALAGVTGAFVGWMLIEPAMSRLESGQAEQGTEFFVFPTIGALVGLTIGCMEGILARNFSRAFKAGVFGLGVGFFGGIVSRIVGGIVWVSVLRTGVEIMGPAAFRGVHANAVVFFMIARSIAWAISGMTVGLGPGLALQSRALVWNGFVGGMIGGLFGGFLFDPINFVVSGGSFQTGAWVSRAIGFCVIGASAGAMIGIVEMLTKDAWLVVSAGRLKGKQFIVYNNPTSIGSSAKCQIFLLKDPKIEPIHALVHVMRDGYELEDTGTSAGTRVNGQRIRRRRLQSGDEIQIGETRLVYSEKEKKPRLAA
jgi:hypothetical protein